MELEFKSLHQVPVNHYSPLVQMLKQSWGHLNELTPTTLESRAQQQPLSYVVYVPALGERPQGIIQTIGLEFTEQINDYDYHHLMQLCPMTEPSIRLCMDITIAEEARSLGLGEELIIWTIFNIAQREPYVNRVLTYSPENAFRWHLRKGAKLTNITNKNGRPGHLPSGVIVTEHTERLNEYRRGIKYLSKIINTPKISSELKSMN